MFLAGLMAQQVDAQRGVVVKVLASSGLAQLLLVRGQWRQREEHVRAGLAILCTETVHTARKEDVFWW